MVWPRGQQTEHRELQLKRNSHREVLVLAQLPNVAPAEATDCVVTGGSCIRGDARKG